MNSIDKPRGKYPTALGNVAILEATYVRDLIDQAVKNIKASNIIPDPAPLKALLPFLQPAQRQLLEPIIDLLTNATLALENFQNNFDVYVNGNQLFI